MTGAAAGATSITSAASAATVGASSASAARARRVSRFAKARALRAAVARRSVSRALGDRSASSAEGRQALFQAPCSSDLRQAGPLELDIFAPLPGGGAQTGPAPEARPERARRLCTGWAGTTGRWTRPPPTCFICGRSVCCDVGGLRARVASARARSRFGADASSVLRPAQPPRGEPGPERRPERLPERLKALLRI